MGQLGGQTSTLTSHRSQCHILVIHIFGSGISSTVCLYVTASMAFVFHSVTLKVFFYQRTSRWKWEFTRICNWCITGTWTKFLDTGVFTRTRCPQDVKLLGTWIKREKEERWGWWCYGCMFFTCFLQIKCSYYSWHPLLKCWHLVYFFLSTGFRKWARRVFILQEAGKSWQLFDFSFTIKGKF